MECIIKLSDYRCFDAAKPATIVLRPGRQAFVGVNNAGKSALLRMIYELRPLWQLCSNAPDLTSLLNTRRALNALGPTGGGEHFSNVIRSGRSHATIEVKAGNSPVLCLIIDSDGTAIATLDGLALDNQRAGTK